MATECVKKLRTATSQVIVVSQDDHGRLRCLPLDRDLADAALKAQRERSESQAAIDAEADLVDNRP